MPTISRFLEISVQMFFGDHPAPHYHATYGGQTAKLQISPFFVIALLAELTLLHEQELLEASLKVSRSEHPDQIEPLG